MKTSVYFLFYSFLCAAIFAQQSPFDNSNQVPKDPIDEFQYIGYFYNSAVVNNIYPSQPLRGQLVGRLFSGNNPTLTGKTSMIFEQRLIPFFIYTPKLLDGKAILRASFEIDWVWGDANYSTGGNIGSAFNADAVNIQTQNVELELIPAKGWAVNLGLQRVFDTPYNPYRVGVNTLTNTGYRLAFWGSDGVGISVRHDMDYARYKLGYYQLFENADEQSDDVVLWELMYEKDMTPIWRQGISFHYIADGGGGNSGTYGLNGSFSGLNGQFIFPIANYEANVFWIGTFGGYNPEFTLGRKMASGFLMYNFGSVDDINANRSIDLSGLAANLRLGYKYGQTVDDNATADLLYVTGDKNGITDKKFKGIITGNSYGYPGAIFISSGTYLLFPHGNVVNRYIAAVTDLSNIGYGLTGATVNVSKGVIPNKLNAKIGFGHAYSAEKPVGGGRLIGTEINARLSFIPRVFMNIELHAAYLRLGSFYESAAVNGNQSKKPKSPWTAFITYKWLMF
ncbi:hypothetical protein HUU42_03935 [bacterium]|nr:hypothetical protein [bacterium]